ncbi:hypothetical protein ACQKQA_24300 [Pseudomonas sp. NPDC089530]|uniref:hypothetical protein n=1 Tax=Pseudomonas sp. NPDC089530 TaxID=3390651 RepID=UPI003D07FBF3
MIRSVLCSLRDFSRLPLLLQAAWLSFGLGLFFVLLYLWVFNLVDYGLDGASVESLTGKVLYVDRGGVLVEDADSGEYTRLKVVRGISYLNADHDRLLGHRVSFTHLRDALLTCNLDGQQLCSAQCASATECLDSRRERESPSGMLGFAFGSSLVCFGLHRVRQRKSAPRAGIF